MPSAATVAGPDPDTAPQNRAVTTVTTASPPLIGPTISEIRRIILSDIFAFPIITPARIKNGIARSENLEMFAKNTGANIAEPSPLR